MLQGRARSSATTPRDIFAAKSGFGGTEYLLAGLVSEGLKRGLPLPAVAALTSWDPARRFGLPTARATSRRASTPTSARRPRHVWTVDPAGSESTQEYSPFRGLEIGATVDATFLRGERIWADGRVEGAPTGRYQHRPTS